jgi:hypothetical protein
MTNETSIYIILNEKLKQMDDWRMPNTVTMLSMLIGTVANNACFGEDVTDKSSITHRGIGNIVLPILSMKEEEMKDFYCKTKKSEQENNMTVFDFTSTAQNSHQYDEYAEKLSKQTLEEQEILGIGIIGDKKPARSLCGSLPRWK